MLYRTTILVIYVLLFAIVACKHEPALIRNTSSSNYPENVADIIINKCAVTGCHNNASYKGAGALNLTTWNKLFEGGSLGSSVIPYRQDFSTLCYYTNTDTNFGVTLLPTMPVNQPALSTKEYLTLRDWILAGAPDSKGQIWPMFDPGRKKIYITNKLCDEVTVFDAETLLQMRYVKVGNKSSEEFPHSVKVAPDKQHWYVSFFVTSDIVQKFSATDDKLIGEINIGTGQWTSFTISEDSRYGFFVDNGKPGKIAIADLKSMTLLYTWTFNDKFNYPTGIAVNSKLKKAYVGNVNGNYIYSIDMDNMSNPIIKERIINDSNKLLNNSIIDPTDLIADTTNGLCYIACTKSAEVRVMDMTTDSIINIIPLGSKPAFMSYSYTTKNMFITCPDDIMSFPGNRGSVLVVNMQAGQVVKKIKSGYQPYGIAVDDEQQMVTVVNANLSPDGTKPHHSSNCIGRNGNVTFIDMSTMELVPGVRSEVAVYPFSTDVR
ncbi:MAG: hypothetical protein KDC07_05160 [Chitinophagaceae bacterium]|nr:hypothetical protein [Chitinophagaceae bacterium]MCB9046131.1 hypothetical protein [Chitinophagales bacterium]